jgi:CheY-like chemotaxis protein
MLPSILFIESNLDVREAIVDLLTLSGNSVTSATDGSEGLELFRKQKFDLVITGSRMPVMDGASLINELAKFTDLPPVIALGSRSPETTPDPLKATMTTQPLHRENILQLVTVALLTKRLTGSGNPVPAA